MGVRRTGLESLILPHAGCVTWGHYEPWYLLCNMPASHHGGPDPTGGHLDRWPSIQCLVHGCMLRCFSRVPVDCGPSGSSVPGILQGRILEWVAMPSSRGSSQPLMSPALAGGFSITSATWEAPPVPHTHPVNVTPLLSTDAHSSNSCFNCYT